MGDPRADPFIYRKRSTCRRSHHQWASECCARRIYTATEGDGLQVDGSESRPPEAADSIVAIGGIGMVTVSLTQKA